MRFPWRRKKPVLLPPITQEEEDALVEKIVNECWERDVQPLFKEKAPLRDQEEVRYLLEYDTRKWLRQIHAPR